MLPTNVIQHLQDLYNKRVTTPAAGVVAEGKQVLYDLMQIPLLIQNKTLILTPLPGADAEAFDKNRVQIGRLLYQGSQGKLIFQKDTQDAGSVFHWEENGYKYGVGRSVCHSNFQEVYQSAAGFFATPAARLYIEQGIITTPKLQILLDARSKDLAFIIESYFDAIIIKRMKNQPVSFDQETAMALYRLMNDDQYSDVLDTIKSHIRTKSFAKKLPSNFMEVIRLFLQPQPQPAEQVAVQIQQIEQPEENQEPEPKPETQQKDQDQDQDQDDEQEADQQQKTESKHKKNKKHKSKEEKDKQRLLRWAVIYVRLTDLCDMDKEPEDDNDYLTEQNVKDIQEKISAMPSEERLILLSHAKKMSDFMKKFKAYELPNIEVQRQIVSFSSYVNNILFLDAKQDITQLSLLSFKLLSIARSTELGNEIFADFNHLRKNLNDMFMMLKMTHYFFAQYKTSSDADEQARKFLIERLDYVFEKFYTPEGKTTEAVEPYIVLTIALGTFFIQIDRKKNICEKTSNPDILKKFDRDFSVIIDPFNDLEGKEMFYKLAAFMVADHDDNRKGGFNEANINHMVIKSRLFHDENQLQKRERFSFSKNGNSSHAPRKGGNNNAKVF